MYFTGTKIFARAKMVSMLSELDAFKVVFDTPRVKNMIIEMNTIEQLYNKGIDSTGTLLSDIGGGYSFVTKEYKSERGVPYDRVTLKDTGDFYKSWRVYITGNLIRIQANTMKDEDLQDRWGDNILGLTEESKGKLVRFAIDRYREYLLKKWK
jgi:hypothetical protein